MTKDDRIKNTAADHSRSSRALEDRAVTEDRMGKDHEEQRRVSLRNEFLYSALPSIPDIPGFHTCWLSTTHQYDHIPNRMRLGYVPVTREDVPPGWHVHSVKSGEWDGCIGINEMLAFKIPIDRYNEIMMELHHDAPMDEETRLKAQTEQLADTLRRHGSRALIGDGTADLGSYVKPPSFR